jgi:general secretion pathway protein L
MSSRRSFVPSARWGVVVRALLARLGQWWLGELMALFPRKIAGWLIGHGRRQLALAPRSGRIWLALMDENRQRVAASSVDIPDYSAAAVDDFLKSCKLARQDVAIGLRLPADQIFGRRLIVPVEASRAMDQVLVQDLTRKTPFRPQDIYCDHVTEKAAEPDKIVVWQ